MCWNGPVKSSALYTMKSYDIRHIRHRLAAVPAEVEGGEVVEVCRRGRPVARIIPAHAVLSSLGRGHAERGAKKSKYRTSSPRTR